MENVSVQVIDILFILNLEAPITTKQMKSWMFNFGFVVLTENKAWHTCIMYTYRLLGRRFTSFVSLKHERFQECRLLQVAFCVKGNVPFLHFQAYKHGLYGPKIVWMFPNWFSLGFWRTELQGVKCTEHEMTQAIEGAFLFGFSYIHDGKNIAGITGKRC